jgi:bifunctional non-homologous end joining protein LigD
VKPKLVCEISYSELTKDGAIRHPSFKGLREDKNAKDIKRETETHSQCCKEEKVLKQKKLLSAPRQKRKKDLTQSQRRNTDKKYRRA